MHTVGIIFYVIPAKSIYRIKCRGRKQSPFANVLPSILAYKPMSLENASKHLINGMII